MNDSGEPVIAVIVEGIGIFYEWFRKSRNK